MGTRQQPSQTGVNLGLIITPMLDMAFQILAFFIMTYHPSALEGHLAGTLAALGGGNNPVAPQVVAAEDLADVPTVVIKVGAAAGQPDKLLVKSRVDPVPRQVADVRITWPAAKRTLGDELKRLHQADAEQTIIRIEADGDLRHEFVLEVYDVCKDAGYAKIHFVAPPESRMAKQ